MPAKTELQDVQRPFVCADCGTRYTRAEHLTRHRNSKHARPSESLSGGGARGGGALIGDQDSAGSALRTSPRFATAPVSGLVEDGAWRAFVCEHCGKGFSRRDVLKRHYQVHFRGDKDSTEANGAAAKHKRRKTDHDGFFNGSQERGRLATRRDSAHGAAPDALDRTGYGRLPPIQLHPTTHATDYSGYRTWHQPSDKPTCDSCRQSNSTCTDGIPCARCTRLAQPCTSSVSPTPSADSWQRGQYATMDPIGANALPSSAGPSHLQPAGAPPVLNFPAPGANTGAGPDIMPYDPSFQLGLGAQNASFDENTLAFLDWATASCLSSATQGQPYQNSFVGQSLWEEPRSFLSGSSQPLLTSEANIFAMPSAASAASGLPSMAAGSLASSGISSPPVPFVQTSGITPVNLTLELDASFGYDGVPHLTEVTRDKIATEALSLQQQTAHAHDVLEVPSTAILDQLLQAYFVQYAFRIRFLHFETFDPNEAPFYLVLAIATQGVKYTTDAEVKKQAVNVLELTRRCLVGLAETPVARSAHAYHFAHYVVLLNSLLSGDQTQVEYAQGSQGALIAACSRLFMLDDPAPIRISSSSDIDAEWRKWRDGEVTKRMGFAVIQYLAYSATFWDFESSTLFMELNKTTFPCSDELFNTQTAHEWHSQFAPHDGPPATPNVGATVQAIFDSTRHGSAWQALPTSFSQAIALGTCSLIVRYTNKIAKLEARCFGTDVVLPDQRTAHSARMDAMYEFFEKRILEPIANGNLWRDGTEINQAILLHLSIVTGHTGLPIATLQRFVKHQSRASHEEADVAIGNWAAAEDGRLARLTAWHAAQMLSLSVARINDLDLRMPDTMALFYAALALWAYSKCCTPPAHPTYDVVPFKLDRLSTRLSTDVSKWINEGGHATICHIPHLHAPGAAKTMLDVFRQEISENKRWQIARLLAQILRTLAGAA